MMDKAAIHMVCKLCTSIINENFLTLLKSLWKDFGLLLQAIPAIPYLHLLGISHTILQLCITAIIVIL